MGEVFYWIGLVVSAVIIVGLLGFAALWSYAALIEHRFELIFFRKSQRRISLASWHHAKLSKDTDWPADDSPVGERPFLLRYQIFGRSIFIMAGTLDRHRANSIRGKHPEEPSND